METNNIIFHRHIYQLGSKTNWEKEYQQVKNVIQKPFLPEKIKIEINRGYNKSRGIDQWLSVYNCPNWNYRNRITGLRPTSLNNIYEGNLIDPEREIPQPGSLIFFEF